MVAESSQKVTEVAANARHNLSTQVAVTHV